MCLPKWLEATEKKLYLTSDILQQKNGLNQIFCLQDCHSWMLKLNIKARHYLPEFLTSNLLLIHVIALDKDWSWNIFTSHIFCSMLINAHWAAHQPQKIEKWELKNWNRSSKLDWLLCTGWFNSQHAYLFPCPILTQILMNDEKVEQSYECWFGQPQPFTNSIKNCNTHEKKVNHHCQKCVQCSPVQLAQAGLEHSPNLKNLVISFCSQNLQLSFGTAFGSNCQMIWQAGAWL